jgi:hypothetical protein
MDEKEVALELLKIYLEQHRERMELDQLVETYLAILQAVSAGPQLLESSPQQPPAGGEEEKKEESDDSLFDFKEPISLSDKEA